MGSLDAATFVEDHHIYCYLILSSQVLLVYDYVITLESEIQFIWSTKLQRSTCWFLAARYLPPSASPQLSRFTLRISVPSCVTMAKVSASIQLLLEGLVSFTLCLRVFAIYGCNPCIMTPGE
ncbi:hypothetical protein K438DRAFT_1760105 [Mycena galopus ATCC 62051]|nr:hypothetical protein K438DRAFT_1760105 [Mycena galopus ATCC 62051]